MAKEKEFKKRLLYVGFQSEDLIKQMTEAKNSLNKTIQTVESILKTTFSDAEKIQLKDNGLQFIKNRITEISPFKNADEDFNLEALGMNLIKSVLKSYEQTSKIWAGYNFELKEGFFEVPQKEVERIIKENSVYTENELQNKCLELAERLIKTLDEIDSLKHPLLKNSHVATAGESKLIISDYLSDGSWGIVPSVRLISKLK